MSACGQVALLDVDDERHVLAGVHGGGAAPAIAGDATVEVGELASEGILPLDLRVGGKGAAAWRASR